MFEKTKKDLEEALKYAGELIKAEKHDPKKIEELPKDIGVYLWRKKTTGKIVYVGRAFGKKGLHQRIKGQHLSDSYPKSVFRNRIIKDGLALKEETVSYIENNFVLSFIPFDRKYKKIAKLVEILLIHECQPKYNHEGKIKKSIS